MIEARTFCEAAKAAGFGFFSGVPCSYFKPLTNAVIDDSTLDYVGAANEGDALAIATGAALGGRPAVAMMQNSGLGNAVSPLTSLNAIFRIPVLLIVTLRGEPGGPADEPQHQLMGEITTKMLELMGVSWDWFPSTDEDVAPSLAKAKATMEQRGLPHALVMKKDTVASFSGRPAPAVAPAFAAPSGAFGGERPSRGEVLRALQGAVSPDDIVVATTGYTGRELYACADRPNQFYMVGSMGCASAFGLGLARARPDRRIIVVDGDGAMLMRLGAAATVGHERPQNLVHILLDNEVHDSTGAQATVSASADLSAVAAACGYPDVRRLPDAEALAAALRDRRPGLRFLHLKTKPGAPADLPRPKITPPEVAARLRNLLAS
ncbi:MAG: phosphonopyruvate decarboxylase [Hyphomicrobiales bacterium]